MPTRMIPRMRSLHEKVILELGRLLIKETPDSDIWPNTKFRKKKRRIDGMLDGSIYMPDLIDFDKQKAYEVTVAGKRKEYEFSNLPPGWTGVNVFCVDICQKDEVYIWAPDNTYVHVTSRDWKSLKTKDQGVC